MYMKISFSNIYDGRNQKSCVRTNPIKPMLKPMLSDSVSFGAMKKNEFNSFDLACVEKFKAPIEKFNKNEDLQNWARKKCDAIFKKDYKTKDDRAYTHRANMIYNWNMYTKQCPQTTRLLILSSITKDLDRTNDKAPPVFDEKILAKTLDEIENTLAINSKAGFDVGKIYEKNLLSEYLSKEESLDETHTGWINIPSEENDPENFNKNVKRLMVLSCPTWCTKNFYADYHLQEGNFHIYMENRVPKLGLQEEGGYITEVQGYKNNGKIPLKHIDNVIEYLTNGKVHADRKWDARIFSRKEVQLKVENIKKDLKEAIETNNFGEIFSYFNIDSYTDKDGMLVVKGFRQPSEDFTFTDLGLNEKKMLKNIRQVEESTDATRKLTAQSSLGTHLSVPTEDFTVLA